MIIQITLISQISHQTLIEFNNRVFFMKLAYVEIINDIIIYNFYFFIINIK